MTCLICDRWSKTPYFKRHTTPTTAQDTETALVLGFWLARRTAEVPKFCERHGALFFQLDTLEDARVHQESAEPTPAQSVYLERAQEVTRRLSAPAAPAPFIPPLVAPAELLGGTGILPPPPAPVEAWTPIGQGQPSPAQDIIPPVPDKPSFPCPLCHKIVVSGEVHTC